MGAADMHACDYPQKHSPPVCLCELAWVLLIRMHVYHPQKHSPPVCLCELAWVLLIRMHVYHPQKHSPPVCLCELAWVLLICMHVITLKSTRHPYVCVSWHGCC